MKNHTTDLRKQVIDAVCFKPHITGHLEQFERIEALISDRERLARKKALTDMTVWANGEMAKDYVQKEETL